MYLKVSVIFILCKICNVFKTIQIFIIWFKNIFILCISIFNVVNLLYDYIRV